MDQATQLKECFGYFEKDGKLSVDDLPVIMRAMNVNPSERQVQEYKAQLSTESGYISWETLQAFIQERLLEQPDTKEILMSAFKVFDTEGTGTLSTNALRHVMMNLGEKYTNEEFDQLVKPVDKNGVIKYSEFADRLLMTYHQLGLEMTKR